ncbi:MAG TPA: c-type cytochrome [Candidatus Acidoferrum sp.]|jgi:mono/diheme cytochrome c family protein
MKRNSLLLLIIVVLIGVGVAAALSILHDGLSARAKPTALEAMLAHKARHLAIPADARTMTNPIPDNAQNMEDAEMHFADHCATCHGNNGGGDTMYGKGLYPKPPDLRLPQTQELSDGEIFWIIENGVRFTGMPGFGGDDDSKQDSWKLVRLIRHFPKLSMDEQMMMEKNNPKSPDDMEEEKQENDFLNGAPAPKESEAHHHH